MPLPEPIAARLEGLYPVADDPRLARVPPDPAAAQAHLRADGRCDLVLGYTSERFAELDDLVRHCLESAAAGGAPDRRDRWAAWVEGAGASLDAGVQLAADRARVQVYLRGHFEAGAVSAAFAAAGCPCHELAVENALALFDRPTVDMIGVELDPDRAGAAVYLSLPNRTRDQSESIREGAAFLLAALLGPGAAASFRAVADAVLENSAATDRIYLSFEPSAEPRWVKIDTGVRPLERTRHVAAALGIDAAPLIEAASARGFDPVSQLGLRLGKAGAALSIYHSLL